MKEDIIIEVEKLTKTYHLYDTHADRLRETFHPFRKKYHRSFNALKDISIQVHRGETFGIIGRNGSGKSTLLQIICGILQPTVGDVKVKGRISALLELGAGFNPDFTGRQNVYIKCAILGLKREEIEARFNDIVAFSEIGDFLEQPVKTYSSGMYVRLAFAIAINVYPDIFVIDEALAVGDAAFQYKCYRRIEEMQGSGTTVMFVTHDVGAVKKLCDRAIWIHEGRIVVGSDAVSVGDQYLDFIRKEYVTQIDRDLNRTSLLEGDRQNPRRSIGHVIETHLLDDKGKEASTFIGRDDLTISIRYKLYVDIPEGIKIAFGIFRSDNLFVCGTNTGLDHFEPPSNKGTHNIFLKFVNLPLLSGSYYLQTGLFDKSGMVFWDIEPLTKEFSVTSPYTAEGIVTIEHYWRLNDE